MVRKLILNFYILNIIIVCTIYIIISFIFLFSGIYYDKHIVVVTGILLLIFPFLSRLYYVIKDKYYVRPISHTELNSIMDHYIITYTDKPFAFDGEKIVLKASLSNVANYRVKNAYKNKQLVWFHLSEDKNSFEPLIGGFIDTHYLQEKRKFKIMIKAKDLKKIENEILFCPINKFIVIVGDLKVKASYEEEFNWYRKGLYLKYVFRNIFWNILFFIPNEIKREIGIYKDKKFK